MKTMTFSSPVFGLNSTAIGNWGLMFLPPSLTVIMCDVLLISNSLHHLTPWECGRQESNLSPWTSGVSFNKTRRRHLCIGLVTSNLKFLGNMLALRGGTSERHSQGTGGPASQSLEFFSLYIENCLISSLMLLSSGYGVISLSSEAVSTFYTSLTLGHTLIANQPTTNSKTLL